MEVILIAAVTADGYIARHDKEVITWSQDLKLFKKQTKGCPVIMGSNTLATLTTDLPERKIIVVHRDDDPQNVLSKIESTRCFVIGGGRTNTRFAPFLTHLYLTVHPLIFGGGIPLFPNLKEEFELEFTKWIPVKPEAGVYQFQYRVKP